MLSPSEIKFLTAEQSALIENGYWDIEDLSGYLKVKIKTLYAMVPDIPHYRVGKLIRFKKKEIDAWMENERSKALDGQSKSGKKGGKRSEKSNTDIERMIRKAIDQTKDEGYNSGHGKSDRIEGPKKEINHGSV